MIARSTRVGLASVTTALAVLGLSACVPNTTAQSSATSIAVDSTTDDCVVSAESAPSGTVVFTIENSTDDATEFYLLADDGKRIVGELENIAPGAPRELTLHLKQGDYFTACKPGMVGDGVGKQAFTVTESAETGPGGKASQAETAAKDAAALQYVAYVRDQMAQFVPATQTFLGAYLAGDDEKARSLYALTRANYERVEPVAESFGNLDPAIDFREADVAEGDEWTGWHRIEKDLWPPAGYVALTPEERSYYAGKLTDDTQKLYDAVHDSAYTVSIDAISNGAIALLDEVASGKITGEEEAWSHTDLWDIQANLEGARVAYEGVRGIVGTQDAKLTSKLDEQFASLEALLAGYGSLETGFSYYDDLSTDQVKKLADGVNALAEPLSRLTGAVVD